METSPIKAVTIDDEADGREIISYLLGEYFPDIQLAGQAKNIAQARSLIQSVRPDIIFLDIEMPDGNAFDLIPALEGIATNIILVTAYSHYAIKAIKASVLDYLLKPIDKGEFKEAVNKALSKMRQVTRDPDQTALFKELYRHFSLRKLRIPSLSGYTLVNIDDIIRCEASGSYTMIVFTNQTTITASQTLGEYEEELKHYGFIRIHHKHLVNIDHLIEYNKGSKGGGFVTLRGREVLEVSARKKIDLLDALKWHK